MYIVVFVTASSKKEAKLISTLLLEEKLAACVNILELTGSYFWWKGKIDHAKEILLMIKTKKKMLSKVVQAVKLKHSYTVPEVIAMPVIGGNRDYLRWISESVG